MRSTTTGWSTRSSSDGKRRACNGDDLRHHQLRGHLRRGRYLGRGHVPTCQSLGPTTSTGRSTVDLSPRQTTTAATPPPTRRRNWPAVALLVAVLVFGGVIVTKFLTSAID